MQTVALQAVVLKNSIFIGKTIDINSSSCYYNYRKEVKRVRRKKKKKPTKYSIDWPQTLVGALVDLIVGTALILIAKLLE